MSGNLVRPRKQPNGTVAYFYAKRGAFVVLSSDDAEKLDRLRSTKILSVLALTLPCLISWLLYAKTGLPIAIAIGVTIVAFLISLLVDRKVTLPERNLLERAPLSDEPAPADIPPGGVTIRIVLWSLSDRALRIAGAFMYLVIAASIAGVAKAWHSWNSEAFEWIDLWLPPLLVPLAALALKGLRNERARRVSSKERA